MRFFEVALVSCLTVGLATMAYGQATYQVKPKGRSKFEKSDVAVGPRAARDRLPKNYQNYYLYSRQQYALSPFIVTNPAQGRPIILGAVRPYSDEEYARLVLSTMKVGNIEPASSRLNPRSIVVEQVDENGDKHYAKAQSKVLDVLDRGTLIVDTREEVRLRGVRLLSERDPDEVMRFYAREAVRTLRNLTQDHPIYLQFEEPLRDADGTLLATVFLSDGTELNRLMVEEGYGRYEPRDYLEEREGEALSAAESRARAAKVGIWSK
jgi:endonuclease YncB( thermonuclease family)